MTTPGAVSSGRLALGTVKIGDIDPAPYNPRSIAPEAREALRASMRRFGLVETVVVNRRSVALGWPEGARPVIVGGHQRVSIAAEEGATEIDVSWVDLGESDEKALNVALNNPHAQGWFTDDLPDLVASLSAPVVHALAFGPLLDGFRAPTPSEWGDAFGTVPHGDRTTLSKMTFVLTDEQVRTVKEALAAARAAINADERGDDDHDDDGNKNRNGNALAHVARCFLAAIVDDAATR
jgi:hypothetical protein